MEHLYSDEAIKQILAELKIEPMNGKVTSKQAASILSWRFRAEWNDTYTLTADGVRHWVARGKLKAYPLNPNLNLFDVQELFSVPLSPQLLAAHIRERKKRKRRYNERTKKTGQTPQDCQFG